MADLARDIDVREEVHLDLHEAVARARLTPATLRVEREAAWAVAARARVRRGREQVADVVEEVRIRCRVGRRHAPDRTLVDGDDLIEVLQPLDGAELAGAHARVIETGRQLLVDDLIDEAGLAGAGHAGHARECAERDLHVDIFEVVFRRAEDAQEISVARPALRRNGNFLFPGQILPGDRARLRDDVLHGACRDDLAAVDARAGADVDDVIRRAHRVLVVLDDKDGVAEVAQPAQRIEQLIVVTLVQADGRLVEDIEHAHQARADLRGEADALAFAAGERCRRARERQIAEADGLQKFEARANFAQDLLRDDGHIARELQLVHEFQLLRDRHFAEIHDAHAADGHGEADVGQALAMALGTGTLGHAGFQLAAHGVRLRFLKAALDVVHDALKRALERAAAVGAVIVDGEVFPFCAVQDGVDGLLRQVADGLGEREVIFSCQRLEIHPGDGIVLQRAPAGGLDGPVEKRSVPVRDDQLGVGHKLCAEACADRACTIGIVEREHPGRKLRQADAAVLAGIVL